VAARSNTIPTAPGTDFPFSKRPVNPAPVTARDTVEDYRPQAQTAPAPAPQPKEDDGEIGIPAFIRRKMI
jgi:hypothetical protein